MTRQQFIDENGNWCVIPAKMAEMALGFDDIWYVNSSIDGSRMFTGNFEDTWAFFDAL